ncbi:MAG: DNA primase, partial [Chitinophagaceae bacterium]
HGRVIFPVHNQTGKIIGFGARILKKNDRAPKYINTPENEIYVKSKILYGTYFARQSIDKLDECLLVEGYTDVISLHQAGIENAVASGGTSLTHDQLRLIKKYTKNLTILYDGDAAGIKAALRGLDLAIEEGLNVKLVLIPDQEDPDSYVRKVGYEAFRRFIDNEKKDFILFKLQTSILEIGSDTGKKAELVRQMAETISKINKSEDFTRQQDYIKQCSELLKIDEQGLISLVNQYVRERVKKWESQTDQTDLIPIPPENEAITNEKDVQDLAQLINKDEKQELGLVRALLEHGYKDWENSKKWADYIFEKIQPAQVIFREEFHLELFDNQKVEHLLMEYKKLYDSGLIPDQKDFIYHSDHELSKLVIEILDFPYELSPNWDIRLNREMVEKEDSSGRDVISSVNYLLIKKVKRLMEKNQKDMEKKLSQDDQMIFISLHQQLKKMEQDLTQQLGTVILK